MKILVYGAGPLGSVFAAKLQQGGHDVSILARGQRLADLREYGIMLHDVRTQEWSTTRVNVVEQLAPEDAYDLVLVIMRRNHALNILPVLAANRRTPNVAFLGNNAAGPSAYINALGRERVLMGFPSSAGYRDGHVIHCATGTVDEPMTVPLGEVDGRITERTLDVARALEKAPGLKVELHTNIDAWLKTHVALLMPSLGPALYAAGTDRLRLARTRDALVLAVRAIREGFRVLQALDIPITPASYRRLMWIPEPLLVYFLGQLAKNELMDVAMVRHANAARDEVQHLAGEFMALAHTSGVSTPAIDRLILYLDPETSPMPDGSKEIPMNWRGVWIGLGALAGALAGLVLVGRWVKGKKR